MTTASKRTPFNGRLLMLGCGSVGRCTLPLVLRHLDMPASRVTGRDSQRATDVGARAPYWVVTTRVTNRAPFGSGRALAPLQVTNVSSAQSGP